MTAYQLPVQMTFQRTHFDIRWVNSPPIRSRAGGVQVVSYGDAFWECMLKTPDSLTSAQVLAMKAWFDRMEGGLHTFLAHDDALPWPSAYPNGFAGLLKQDNVTPFTGTAACSAIGARLITVTGLPDLFQFRPGDYLGLVQASRYSLHRVVDTVTADTAGVATNVPVVPPIKTSVFTTAASVNLARPLAEFVPDPATWDGQSILRFAPGIPVSFGGISRVAP